MLRPVWSFPRHNEADTSETLQSDVMRFIAILALCLVAIFALVQSLPLHPVAKPSAGEPVVEAPPVEPVAAVEPSPAPEPEPVNDMSPPETQPVPLPALKKKLEKETNTPSPPSREAARVVAPMPRTPAVRKEQKTPKPRANRVTPKPPAVQMPKRSAKSSVPTQPEAKTPTETATSTTQEGLLLRFASDNALLALVTQRRVEVYAWVRDAAWQLSSERGVLSFTQTTAPKHFHNMMPDTVPRAVSRALKTTGPTTPADAVTWGVTLPADTKRQLERLVMQHKNGTLIIEANGRVRFKQSG